MKTSCPASPGISADGTTSRMGRSRRKKKITKRIDSNFFSMVFRPESQIGNYFLVRRLGRGGFGEVWLAERRTKFVTTKVAVKLPLDEQVEHELIKQEAQLWERASGHPNVLPIIEADEYDGQVVIVSEYAPDGSLADLLAKSGGSLSLEQAIEITTGILSGLEFLHSKNIIHRDLKPENVLLQGNTPRLADFGISRLMKNHSASLNAAGTPNYMAPEAFDRKRTVQTDIWAIGVMLYQMIAGSFPFVSDNVAELIAAIVAREPKPLPKQTPSALQSIVGTALAKQSSQRYQTSFDMRSALQDCLRTETQPEINNVETLQFSTIKNPTISFSESAKKTIAILPFKNMGGDPASEFYEFSLADAVTTELARLRSLIVRPSSVIANYQGKQIDVREAGREMKVNSILSAGFIHSGTRLRVTAQLLDVATGDIIWSDRIDSDGSDIFAIQDAVTQAIIDGLQLNLSTTDQQHFGQRPTNNNEAYEEYLKGRDKFARFIWRTLLPADCDAALESFTRAVELDPDFALAWSGIGACFANKVFKAMGSLQDYEQAEIALNKAVALDPNISETRVLLCFVYLARGEKVRVRSELVRLCERFPNDATVYFLKGVIHRIDGEYEEAVKSFDRLERLDPSSAVAATYNRARAYFLQGETEQALEELDRAAAVEPNHPMPKVFRAQILCYEEKGKEAELLLKGILAKNPHLEGLRPLLAIALLTQDLREEALENLTQAALEKAGSDHDIAYWVASSYGLLGEPDKAFEWLECSIKLGLEDVGWFRRDINLKNIRNNRRFGELMEQIESNRKTPGQLG